MTDRGYRRFAMGPGPPAGACSPNLWRREHPTADHHGPHLRPGDPRRVRRAGRPDHL